MSSPRFKDDVPFYLWFYAATTFPKNFLGPDFPSFPCPSVPHPQEIVPPSILRLKEGHGCKEYVRALITSSLTLFFAYFH